MSFYLYVASNESKDFFASNTNAKFKNSVNPPISLNAAYECALVELITPTVELNTFKSSVSTNKSDVKVQNVEIPGTMIIYTNVVVPSTLGGSSFPLLRIISTIFKEKSKNTTTSKIFSLPFYKKVCTSYLSEIEISINTQSGAPFPFPSGVSFAVLHFRPQTQ
jgi:hypothetical protein